MLILALAVLGRPPPSSLEPPADIHQNRGRKPTELQPPGPKFPLVTATLYCVGGFGLLASPEERRD